MQYSPASVAVLVRLSSVFEMPTLNAPHSPAGTTRAVPEACNDTRRDLDAFVDGEVDEPTGVAMRAHLAECHSCGEAERSLRRLLAAIERSRRPVMASRRLRLRVAMLFAEQQEHVAE